MQTPENKDEGFPRRWLGTDIGEAVGLRTAVERVRGGHPDHSYVSHKSATLGNYCCLMYICGSTECKSKRHIIYEMVDKKRAASTDENTPCKMFELGSHINGHAPLKTKHRLNQDQLQFLEGKYGSNASIKPTELFNELKGAGLAGGLDRTFVTGWLKRRRKKDNFVKRDRSPFVQQIENWLTEMQGATEFEGNDQHRLLLCPIPKHNKHLWIGDEAKGQGGSKLTSYGRALTFCVPLSTPALLRNKINARNLQFKAYDLESLNKLGEEGMKMKDVDSRGLLAWDGIPGMINGDYCVLFFATVCNGQLGIVGVSITSGETWFNVDSSKSAFDSAAERIFNGQDTRSEWVRCDSALANLQTVAAHKDNIDKAATACSVKLLKNTLPKQKTGSRTRQITTVYIGM